MNTKTFNSNASDGPPRTRVRFWILFMLFLLTVVNYADRATLSITGTSVAKEFGMSTVELGFVFSAFGWSYALGQIPGGWLLDKFGSKRVYGASLFLWSLFTLLQGFVGSFSVISAVVTFFFLRFMLGLVESPAFPANGRITATWFPTAERGVATSIFNSAQYFATVLFAPLMGWMTHAFGWHYVFIFMGGLGLVLTLVWMKVIYEPKQHPKINAAELAFIEAGGALVDMDQAKVVSDTPVQGPKWAYLKQLLTSRMLIGVYIGQYCITALTYFFITWFPIYLIKGRGMSILQVGFVAALPAICGFTGGLLGGALSDYLLRKGYSVTLARKAPFVIGMFLSTTLVICNFLDAQWAVIAVMAFAFFGKGFAAIGWAVIADASPKETIGLTGGVFNGLGNVAGIITPIVIGYILNVTGSFNGALYFVGAHSLLAMFSYLFIVGEIKRIKLKSATDSVLAPAGDVHTA